MSIVELRNTAGGGKLMGEIKESRVYHCDICLVREDDGSFSAIVMNLPGVGSCGETPEEAVQHVREAIAGVLESYAASGEAIPWKDSTVQDGPENTVSRRWILVNAQ